MTQPQENLALFADRIKNIKEQVDICPQCFCLKNKENCLYCDDFSRNQKQLCIVEERENVLVIEDYGIFQGLYHVLEGSLSPINGVHPENLRIKELLDRVRDKNFEEIIMATNTTIEGEATSQYLTDALGQYPLAISRLACGIPSGGEIKYTDKATLGKAFQHRRTNS